jgi:hypothetical protein
MAARFDTADYFRSHGKQPRGTGCWAFAPNTTGEWDFSPSMTFSEAKAWAAARHPEATVFTVGP